MEQGVIYHLNPNVENDWNNVLEASKKCAVVVDFYADWCGPCKMLGADIEARIKESKPKVYIVKVNVDDFGEISEKYGVSGIPHVMVLKDEKKVQEFVGYNKPALKKFLTEY